MGSSIYAQHNICGLTQEDDQLLIQRTRINKARVAAPDFSRFMVDRYVPIVYHIIRNTDGSSGISAQQVYKTHCDMNTFYAEQETGIQFYLQELNYIDNDAAFQDHYNAGDFYLRSNKRQDAINVYIPATANYDPDGLYNVAGYYSPGDDWVVVGRSNMTGSTIFHELGHFLSLPHPFRGWDWEPYDPNMHGVQVGNNSPSGIPNEKMDGSNCEFAGDLICDTAPDYNHFGPNWGCAYGGGAKDPNGELIDPLEQNLMGYFLSCNEKVFTQGQIDVMHADIDNRIAFGILDEVDNVNIIPLEIPTLIAPIMDFEIVNNAFIDFEWEAVDGAQYYELWIDFSPSFGALPIKLEVPDNKLTYDGTDLFKNKTYYWQVKPRNDQDFCADWSENGSFVTGSLATSTKSLVNSGAIKLFPNPVGQDGLIFIENTVASDWNRAAIYNANGSLILNPSLTSQPKGAEIKLKNLASGIYFLEIWNDEGERLFERFVVH